MSVEDGFYRRHLPHWQVDGAPHFITWRLAGALPRRLASDFIRLDAGPFWLSHPHIATLVVNTLHHGQDQLTLYELLAWVVMPNHVHVVIYPHSPLAQITKTIKNYTASQANRMLRRTGQFWQHESFDRWIRNRYELERIIRYVEHNPVKAGLVSHEGDWPWSSYTVAVGQASGLSPRQAGGLPYADGDSNATTANGGTVIDTLW